jgi:hypothetical protein
MARETRYGLAHASEESIRRIVDAGGDVVALVAAFAFLKEDTRAREAKRNAEDHADRPRYVIAADWPHFFSDDAPERDTRWVFDRRQWRLSVLHVKRRSSDAWLMALEDELKDVNDSMVDANAGALDLELDDFGLLESNKLPEWAGAALTTDRQTFVENWRGSDEEG